MLPLDVQLVARVNDGGKDIIASLLALDDIAAEACYFIRVPASLSPDGKLFCQVAAEDINMATPVKFELWCGANCIADGYIGGTAKALKAHRRLNPLDGRFSGRLASKGDEVSLVAECHLLAPLLLGDDVNCEEDLKRGTHDGSRMTLSKLVRCMASGEIRRVAMARKELIQSQQETIKKLSEELSTVVASKPGSYTRWGHLW
eukprot:gene10690-12382_t